MAARDIMPFKSPLGGTFTVKTGRLSAAQTFEIGEPIGVVNAGTIQEMPIDESPWQPGDADTGLQMGIACYGPGAANINPQTGTTYTTNDEVSYWPINEGIIFITDNFMDTTMATAVTPVQTDVGEAYQVSYSTAAPIGWGIEQTAATAGTDVEARIVDVLDINKAPISRSGGTGVYLLFELVCTST